jgi:hypothetical protein
MQDMKTLRIIILFIPLLLLASPAAGGDPSRRTVKKPSAPRRAAIKKADPWQALEVAAWAGKKFVLLEKPVLYCEYGYELYSSPHLDAARGAIDTTLFTKHRRARCDVFAGRTLTVVSAIKEKKGRGPECVVTFADPLSGKKLYAKTAEGVCHELAYAADRDSAENRWLDKNVFSARGFITDFSGNNPVTVKVDLRDSLLVTGVKFGLTPLPAKPLWLMVESRAGAKGTIPLNYSWTNVAKKLRHEGRAWEDDLYETGPAVLCEAGSAVWETINEHHVNVTMTREQVRMSWGRPVEKKQAVYNGAPRECWTYESQNLYFDEKELVGIEESGK